MKLRVRNERSVFDDFDKDILEMNSCNVLQLQASYGSRRILCLSYPDICHHVSSQMDMPQT